jgi:hypothetical protein
MTDGERSDAASAAMLVAREARDKARRRLLNATPEKHASASMALERAEARYAEALDVACVASRAAEVEHKRKWARPW